MTAQAKPNNRAGRQRNAGPAIGDLFEQPRAWPAGLRYEDEFLSASEEAALLAAIADLPLHEATYKGYTARRRTASFGSSYDFGANTLNEAPPLPSFLLALRDKVAAWAGTPAERFAHGLVTEYRPGTQLGWHRDVPQFALIVGISLGSACRMRFRPYVTAAPTRRNDPDAFDLELRPRSIYAMADEARWRWQHSIPPTPDLRFSITFRTMRDTR